MKLHLPQSLRGALLACFASVAGLTTTLATGAFAGGVFYVSLSQVAQAAEVAVTTDTTWSNEAAEGHAGDMVTVDGGDTAITLQVGQQGGTNQFGSIAEAYRSMDFGTVTVNAGDTLKLWTWTGTNKELGSANKVAIESAITLNQAQLRIEDGSYYFAGAITITGTSSIRTQYAKGISLAHIDGDENAVLELVRGIGTHTQKDDSRAVFELTAANVGFSGTVKLVDDNGTPNVGAKDGLQLVLSDTNALVNAVLDFGETEDVTLALNASKVMLKAIKGHGFVEYYNSTSTVGEIELTAAAGTFSGTSAANVNWTISGGNQVLSNASILGTYTVGKDASSTFEGAITLGSVANAGTIDVTNMTSLTINNQQAYQGATITGLGTLTGLSGNTFTYGNGWLATYDSASGSATLSDSAIWWRDTADDDESHWSTADNWVGSAVPAGADVRLVADANVHKNIVVDTDINVGKMRVDGSYTLHVAEGASYTLTTTGITYDAGAALAKTGAGTLNVTSAVAANSPMEVREGALKITDTINGDNSNSDSGSLKIDKDFTGITGAGTLKVTLDGDATYGGGYKRATIKLDSQFTGTLEVQGGTLDRLSSLGSATVKLNNAGLYGRETPSNGGSHTFANNLEIVGNSWLIGQGASGSDGTYYIDLTGAVSGDGCLSVTGEAQWAFKGNMSNFTGDIAFANKYDYIKFESSANVGSLTFGARLGESAHIVFGNGTQTMTFAVADAMTVGNVATLEIKSNATLANADLVTINADTVLKGAGTYEMNGGVSIASGKKLDIKDTLALKLAAISQTVSSGEIALATGATVNDSRALTIDGAYTISGAGKYNQLGSLVLTADGELTLSGVVSIASLADNNAGTITFADGLTALRLGDFAIGAEYVIGNVADGGTKDWNTLLGYDARQYSIAYADGVLTSNYLGDIVWASPEDDDITWGGANWKIASGSDFISITAADDVTLDAIDTTAETPVYSTIELAANTAVANLTVNDAYTLSIAAGATYSFEAGNYAFGANGSLSKAGEGTLSMSLAQATAAKMHISEGALKLTDAFSHTLTQDSSGRVNYDLTGITAGENGVLQVDLNGTWNGAGLDATAVALDATFQGTLEVVDGQLLVKYGDAATEGKSDFGGASAVLYV